jgi:hypothetical protein
MPTGINPPDGGWPVGLTVTTRNGIDGVITTVFQRYPVPPQGWQKVSDGRVYRVFFGDKMTQMIAEEDLWPKTGKVEHHQRIPFLSP